MKTRDLISCEGTNYDWDHRAYIATLIVMFYILRIRGDYHDTSYDSAWLNLWVIAEKHLDITVTDTLLLPKFIEAEDTKLRGVFSNLARPFVSLTCRGCFGILMRRRKDKIGSREVGLDTVTMIRNSESDLSSTNRDRDIQRSPSYEHLDNFKRYSSLDATDTSHRL